MTTSSVPAIPAEPEITSPTRLVVGNRLNPEAIGWMRQPLIDTSGVDGKRTWGRNKRWEYWNVITPTHILALTVSSLDYATVNDVWVFDRATSDVVHLGKTNLGSGSVVLPATLGDGPARAKSGTLKIDIVEEAGGTRLKASIPGASFDVFAERPEGHESLAVVVPWSTKRFQYTEKDVARPASGSVTTAPPAPTRCRRGSRGRSSITAAAAGRTTSHGTGVRAPEP